MVPDDVARALSHHLAEYSEIVNIKATNDKKGGMCAFIQCQVRLDGIVTRSICASVGSSCSPRSHRTMTLQLACCRLFVLLPNDHFWDALCDSKGHVRLAHC